jgi:predicted Zn-dependent protease with MMP-like domain
MVTAMTRERFRELVAEALDEIPEPFLRHLQNVEVVVDDEPQPELLREMGMDPRRDVLFGLYEGVPADERGDTDHLLLPDRISIFYRPLVRAFRTPGAIRREVRKTVIHEIAHFFGMSDEEIDAEGY